MASIKRRGDVIRVRLQPEERGVLTSLAAQIVLLLDRPESADADPLESLVGLRDDEPARPDDPALGRLLPDAYDDPEGAAEFRRLMDDDLRRGKTAALEQMTSDLAADGSTDLTPEQADAWARAINDIRLVLGVRIGVDDDGHWRRGLSPDDERLPLLAAYDWLSALQELLLDALL
jgi:hypothetical protein